MTALSEYQRLECPGLWRDRAGSQRRDVVVVFGDATLVISDGRTDTALTHWSLPAILRLNPGSRPAIFAPGPDAEEQLELSDDAMIAALSKLHSLIEARKPHPGRLRLGLLLTGLIAVIGAGLFWIPGVILSHTASVVPEAKRAEIGRDLLADMFRVSGAACSAPEGRAALDKLGDRVLGHGTAELVVLGSGLSGARHLPGDYILIGRDLIEGQAAPDVLAGHLLAETARAAADDPLRGLLRWAGVGPAFRLLTTGDLPADRLIGYSETLIGAPPTALSVDDLAARFGAAGVSAKDYAASLGETDAFGATLLAADPYRTTPPPSPVLEDADWVALQGICGG